MKKIRLLLMCVAGICYCAAVMGQNEKFKALFIYNFTNYIEWPAGNKSFTIAVLGESPIIGELQAISKIKKVGSLPIEVQKVNSPGEVGSAQIIYVPASKKKNLPEIAKSLSGKSVLIISDGALSEFGINFIEVDQKQSFQISKLNIELRKMKVNSALLALGIPVN